MRERDNIEMINDRDGEDGEIMDMDGEDDGKTVSESPAGAAALPARWTACSAGHDNWGKRRSSSEKLGHDAIPRGSSAHQHSRSNTPRSQSQSGPNNRQNKPKTSVSYRDLCNDCLMDFDVN